MNRSTSPLDFGRERIRYDALMSLLEDQSRSAKERGKCFQIPVSKIAREFHIAGNDVGGIMRSQGRTCQLNPDDQRLIPWIDFLAAGVDTTQDGPINWVALVTSNSDLGNHAFRSQRVGCEEIPDETETERITLFRDVTARLKTFLESTSSKNRISVGSGTTVWLRKLLAQHVKSTGWYPAPDAKEPFPELLFVTLGASDDRVKQQFGTDLPFKLATLASIDDFHVAAVGPLRWVFGSGWFGNISHFMKTLPRPPSGKKATSKPKRIAAKYMKCDPSSPGMAAAAASKMTEFGWLPPHLNFQGWDAGWQKVRSNPSAKPTAKESAMSRLFEDGLRVYKLPRVELPGERKIVLKDLGEPVGESWLQNESSFEADCSVLVVEFTGYGSREMTDVERGDHFWVFPVCSSSLGVLRKFLPGLRMTMIGYTPGSSCTTGSGRMEKLVERFLIDPQNKDEQERLKGEVLRICYPTSVLTGSTVDLRGTEAGGELATDKSCSPEMRLAVEQMRESLAALMEMCHAGVDAGGMFHALRLGAHMLEMEPQDLQGDNCEETDDPLSRFRLLFKAEEQIEATAASREDIKVSRDRHFPLDRLLKGLAAMLTEVRGGVIGVPEQLSNFVSSMARLLWVTPLNNARPCPPRPTQPDAVRTYPESGMCVRHYPHLFSTEIQDGAIKVDLEGLLRAASKAISGEAGSHGPGWLSRRISGSNQMMAGMMVRCGYVADFPLDQPPKQDSSGNGLFVLLRKLDSRLIIHCIKRQEKGKELLDKLCDGIVERFHAARMDNGMPMEYVRGSERPEAVLDIFRDTEGIAAAALDCCRTILSSPPPSTGASIPLAVYFLPDRLLDHFRPRILATFQRDIPLREYLLPMDKLTEVSDGSSGSKASDKDFWFEETLAKALMSKGFRVYRISHYIEEWINGVGRISGEHIADLLEDITRELFEKTDPPRAYLRNCRAILRKYAPESLA